MKAFVYLFSFFTCAAWAFKTDVDFHPKYTEVDIGEGHYSCNDYLKLYDKARDDCLSTGCSDTKKACDSQVCAAIDGTTNQGVADDFKDYLKQLRTVLKGSCKEDKYDDYNCNPSGFCGNVKRVRVQIPSFLGTSTAANSGKFMANYKVTFSNKEQKSTCETITTLVSAGLGALPGGSLFGSTALTCT